MMREREQYEAESKMRHDFVAAQPMLRKAISLAYGHTT